MAQRALVLGGGGITGIAWELGLLQGLAEAGVDLTGADVVIGTSAGSVVGAQITSGRPLAEWYAEQLEPADSEIGARFGAGTMLRIALPAIIPGKPLTRRRRIGAAALKAQPGSADDRLRVIRSRIGVSEWPQRDLRVVAVDATTGASRVFTPDSGVDLIHAVAASCAVPIVWPPVPIDGVPYVDGGMRSSTNADLATGAERVVVLAPLPKATSRYMSIRAQMERLTEAGGATHAAVVAPDKDAKAAIGRNVLDPAKRAGAARAGHAQAAGLVEQIRTVWG